MKSQLISSMASFVLGTGATLVALSSWLGTSDLQAIKSSVEQYTIKADEQVSALLSEYNVTVNNANAEIGEYKQALQQANDNISQLITAYEDKVDEMEQAQASAEQDLADLQAELDNLYARMDSQYETDMNAIIEQANAEINQANQEVADTKEQVQTIIIGSGISSFTIDDHKEHLNKLDTTGDKTVTDISEIVGEEEQVQE